MSDLFHEEIPSHYIHKVFRVMEKANWHTYQVLTKRTKRLLDVSSTLTWHDHIWMGVSVEDNDQIFRINHLIDVPAKLRFLSLEPLLGPIDCLPLKGIDWVIVGGESGHKARPMDESWVRSIRDQCQDQNVPFFLKQLGGKRTKRGGDQAKLDGRLWHQIPEQKSIMSSI